MISRMICKSGVLLGCFLASKHPVVGQNILITECLEDAKFFLVNEPSNFEEAKVGCMERNGTLARISNFEEHTLVKSFFDNIPLSQAELVWIGKSN